MKRLYKKLRSRVGETLVETLFAILIIAFASITLAAGIMTAAKMNRIVKETDDKFEIEIAWAEAHKDNDPEVEQKVINPIQGASYYPVKLQPLDASGNPDGEVIEYDVSYYGGVGKLSAYESYEEAGG